MIDFSRAIPYKTFLGKVLRMPFSLMPKGFVVSIKSGPLRHRKWIFGAGLHGCWLGTYELEKQKYLSTRLRPGMIFYDIGANVGFYTLLAAELVGNGGKVYAFEPLPENLAFLRKHVEMNCYTNVEIFDCAVLNYQGQALMRTEKGPSMASVSDDGSLMVQVCSLDEVVDRGIIDPADAVKVDVEGAELQVLEGGARFFTKYQPLIFLATHSEEVHQACCKLLDEYGYALESIERGKPVSETNEILAFPHA